MLKFQNKIKQIKFNNCNIAFAKINNKIVFGKETEGKPLYKFGLLSDIHIDGDGTDTYNTIQKYNNAINFYKQNADFLCITGDISYDGRENDFIKYAELTNGIEVKTISGNHDAIAFNLYTQHIGDNLNYEFQKGNDIFLMAGAGQDFSYTKPFTDTEMDWLEQKLEEYKDRRVFLMIHFFISPVGNANNLAKTDILDTTSTQGSKLLNILTEYKNIIFCAGHSHLEFEMEKYDPYGNFMSKGNTCARVHIPSLGYPKTNDTGVSNNDTYNLKDVGYGYLVEVYNSKVVFRAVEFALNSYRFLEEYIYEANN